MHFVFEINSAGRDIKSVQALRRFLKGKLTDAGLEVKVVSAETHEFVVVSASTDRLEQEAHLLSRLERDTAFFFSRTDYGVETSRDNLDVSTLREREQLLRSILNSIKISTDDLTTLRWQDVETHHFTVGDPLISAMFTHTNVFLSAFPLHDEEGRDMLRSQLLRLDCPSPTVVRAYCGSKVAIFMALLRSLTVWFAVLGVAALAAEVAIHIQGLSSVWAMLYGCMVPVWSALFLKYWRRRDATLIWEWDFGKLKNDVHLMRWHLRGEQRMFQATNKASLFRLSPAIKRHLAVSVPLVTSLLLPSTVFMLVSLNLEGKLSDSSPWHWPRVVDFGKQYLALDRAMPRILVSGAQSAVLYFVNRVYSKYSYALTKWEGWYTEEEFGGSLALKRLPFELATMLISPLIHVVWGADPLTLRLELIGIMLGDTASRLLTEVAWPVLYAFYISKYAHKFTANAATEADRAMATRVLRESQLPKLEFFDCYCFLIRYYIIATCFASVFPLGALVITVLLYSEAKICVFLMTRCRQRIPSMRATSIGIWFDVLRFVSAMCITCNVILQAHTTTQLSANFGHTALVATAGAFGAGFAVEQILRLLGWLISMLVPDVPPRVRESGKGREKAEAAKRRWADIHSTTTTKTEGGTGATQATRRAAVAEMSARGDLLPSLQG